MPERCYVPMATHYKFVHTFSNVKYCVECNSRARIALAVVVVVDPLLPDYWGESASVVFWGFAASFSRQLSSSTATPEGSLHNCSSSSRFFIKSLFPIFSLIFINFK